MSDMVQLSLAVGFEVGAVGSETVYRRRKTAGEGWFEKKKKNGPSV